MTDTVLYKQIGRAPRMPVVSYSPDTPELDMLIAVAKQRCLAECVASGGQMPTFTVDQGSN